MSLLRFKKTVLANGLRLVTIPMKGTQTVSILFMFNTGSDYETRDLNGISHFLEHLFFKGTVKHPTARDVAKELDKYGATFNAFTDREVTGYYITIDAQEYAIALDVMADMILNSTFLEEEIEKERGVIKEEIKMYRDNPMRHINDLWYSLLYGDQPAGWTIGGGEANIDRITRRDLVSYRHLHYHAGNSVLVVAGSFGKTLEGVVRNLFGGVPNKERDVKTPVRETQDAPQVRLTHRAIDQTHVIVGVRALPLLDERREAERVLSVVLGENMSSRLFTEVREKLGLAYAVRTSTEFHTDHGYFAVRAGLDSNRVGEALNAILKEFAKIRSDGITAEELADAKTFIKGSARLELEESSEVAQNFAVQELLEQKLESIEEAFERVDRVSRDDVIGVARMIFTPERLNLVALGPQKKGPFMREIPALLDDF